MALELVEDDDNINSACHSELDERLWGIFGGDAPPDSSGILGLFLWQLVADWEYLDQPAYSTPDLTRALLKCEEGLGPKICALWKIGFKEIRSLKILQRVPLPLTSPYAEAVIKAFATEYQGSTAALLSSVIDDTYGADGATTYLRAISIIQSSGMGKSKTIDEVAKSRITFPICIREDTLSGFAYPLVDKEVRNYFTQVISRGRREKPDGKGKRRQDVNGKGKQDSGREPEQDDTAQSQKKAENNLDPCKGDKLEPVDEFLFLDHVLRFLAALFGEAYQVVNTWNGGNPATYGATAAYMYSYFANGDERKNFYRRVITNANQGTPINGTQVTRTVKAFLDLVLDRDSVICPTIVSLDEVQVLLAPITETKNRFDVVCSALASVKDASFFVVFLSTASILSKPAPTVAISSSYRPRNNRIVLPAPFTELGFDVFAKGIAVEDQLDLESVKDFSFLVRFGRPMWASLWNSLRAPDESDAGPRRIILETAMGKLVGQDGIEKPLGFRPSLAVLSVRLLLDISPAREAARLASGELVASHMRTAFSVPRHREYMHTGAPTEPVLAEAAARLMNAKTDGGQPVIDVLRTLGEYFRDGFAPRGERGEFIGRVLDILAIDSAIEAMGHSSMSPPASLPNSPPPSSSKHPPVPPPKPPLVPTVELPFYGTPVRVEDYLKHLLGLNNYNKIKDNLPSNPSLISPESRPVTLEAAFANAYVHATHYVRAEDSSVLQPEYLWAYWARGTAFQLKPCQTDSDRAIPIHWTSFQGTGAKAYPSLAKDRINAEKGEAGGGKAGSNKKSRAANRRPGRKERAKAGKQAGKNERAGGKANEGEGTNAKDVEVAGAGADDNYTRKQKLETSSEIDVDDKGALNGETDLGVGGAGTSGQSNHIQKLGRHTCSVILHQDKNATTAAKSAIRMQLPEDGMFASVWPKPVLAITHIYDTREPPSITPGVSSKHARGTPKEPQAPIYEITICGLQEDNYGPVRSLGRNAFQALLASGSIYEEHTRQSRAAIDALRQLKPGFSENPASTSWMARRGDYPG